MSAPDLSRARDRLEGDGPGPIDLEPLVGEWSIFADSTTGIARVVIEEREGAVTARAFGAVDGGEADWGEADVRAFRDDVAGSECWGFLATYDHGYERVQLNAYLNRGLLAVEAATTFTDSSGRAPYFTRTFMFRR